MSSQAWPINPKPAFQLKVRAARGERYMKNTQRTFLYFLPIALLVVESVTLIIGGPAAPHHFLNPINKNVDFTIAAVAVTIAAMRHAKLVPTLAIGLLLEAVRLAFLAWHHITFFESLSSTGLGFWYASLLLAGLRAMRSQGAARWEALDAAAIVFALPAIIPLLGFFLWLTTICLPETNDIYLYAFDGLLPIQLSRIVAEAFARHDGLRSVFQLVYNSLGGVFGLYVILQGGPDGQLSGQLVSRWIVAGCLGYIGYFCLPGVGPQHTFGSAFPIDLPDPNGVKPALLVPSGDWPRNAMPSMHTSWAFLILLATRNMPLIARIGALTFMIATLISTLGLGEHYLIDLVVAIPFTVAVDGLVSLISSTATNRRQVVATVGGAAITGAWLLILRYGVESLRGMPWAASWLVLGTLAASGWLLFWPAMLRGPMARRLDRLGLLRFGHGPADFHASETSSPPSS